jgi:hypothetical protein
MFRDCRGLIVFGNIVRHKMGFYRICGEISTAHPFNIVPSRSDPAEFVLIPEWLEYWKVQIGLGVEGSRSAIFGHDPKYPIWFWV